MRRKSVKTVDLKCDMADALFELMKEKDFSKITIDELTKRAKVGRVTYFRNFKSKEEIVSFKLFTLWREWSQEHGIEEHHQFTVENSKDFFEFNYSIREYIDLIYKAKSEQTIYDAFYEVMKPQFEIDGVLSQYEVRFYCYGIFGLLDYWVKNGYKETPEEMTEFMHRRFKED